ncbi:AAA family ATPase [Pseudoduganella sp. DS3]|uniref:AAA family ATPase n=1 Tax=Pseudoduganella guangdongensis TaxID=2692179 RepID=A0A6N9HMK3_9BURK|nr:winged helix-turn-helix domain-containing protein [Pseudoduganella guangdongensis]MYN04888.1 AAA family ATPase [Pseudoduganella guangdongensis]
MEFQFGDWLVSPEANIVSNGEAKTQLEPRVMAVLRYLCRHPGAVIPAEEILQACWGSNELGDNPVHKAITQLRRAFGDSSTEPRYIETIRKRGYRAIAPIVTFAAPPSTVWEGGSPFRGLEAFQENHAAIFFGRVQATAQLRDLVMTQAAHGCPMALVLGPSGSGKTSLVRAGLLPHLMASATRSDEPIGLTSTVYLDCADLGSGTLFQALAGALIDADINGQPLFPGASADSLGSRLAEAPEAVAAELRERACSRAVVGVFVDRLEAVFRAQPGEADRFIAVIDALAKSNCLLMLMACRNDFYPDVMAQPVLLTLKTRGGHFDLLPPDGADIAQIVREPAKAASLTFEKDETTGASLDDVLCDAARGNHDMLPLLQYTLNELYRQRGDDGSLRFDVFRQLGGIEGAVGVRAEQVVSQLTASQLDALPHVLSLIVNVGEDHGSVTSRRSPLSLLRTEEERELVRVMVEARLFVSELAGEVPSFGVAHEALLRQWPRVSEWIEHHRHALQLRSRISGQANRWLEGGRSRDLLLPQGTQVAQASELLALKDFSLAPIEKEYVSTSLNRARFSERVRLGVTILIGLLAILTAIFALRARFAQQEAERNRTEAEGLMTYMLGDFLEKLRPIGRLDLLDDVGTKALAYVGRKDESGTSLASLVSRIKAMRLIGEVHGARGRSDEQFKINTAIKEFIHHAPSEFKVQSDFLKEAGANAFLLGTYYRNRNELDTAEKYLVEYREFSIRYAANNPSRVEGWLEQSYAHSALGALAMTRSDYQRAKEAFTKSLSLQRQAAEAVAPDDKKKSELANTLSWIAETSLKSGEPATAMKFYREEQELLMTVQASNARAKNMLAASLMRQATLSTSFGERVDAQRALAEAVQIMNALSEKDPTNRMWQQFQLQAKGRLAEARLNSNNTAEILNELNEVCTKITKMMSADTKNIWLANLSAKFDLARAQMLIALNRRDDAFQLLEQVIERVEVLHTSATKDMSLLSTYVDSILTKADIVRHTSGPSSALSLCKRSFAALDVVDPNTNDYTLLALSVRTNLCLGNSETVNAHLSKLKKMGYRDERFRQLISTNPLIKGTYER